MIAKNDVGKSERRKFIERSLLAVPALALAPSFVLGQDSETAYQKARKASQEMVDNGPAVNEEMVFEFVHKGHFSLDRVKELYALEPTLLNAVWDWGGGDYESAIGAASHTGNREIVMFLLEKGARPNLFTATTLGHLEIVKGFIKNYPYLKDCKGPHGLSLIHHAKKGAEQAKPVLDYLNSLK